MRKSFTQEMSWLHTWAGLIMGWLLVPVFLTGSLCVFWHEITVWARPEAHAVRLAPHSEMLKSSLDYLEANAPNSRTWQIFLPFDSRNPVVTLVWKDPAGKTRLHEVIPDVVARPIVTQTRGGKAFVDFHWILNPYSSKSPAKANLGLMLIGAVGIGFLVSCVTGVVVHKRIFKDFFVFRPAAKSSQRKWLDAHNVLGVLPFPFHVMIVVTGLAYYCFLYSPAGLNVLYDGQYGAMRTDMQADRYTSTKGETPGAPAPLTSIQALLDRTEATFGKDTISLISIRDPGRANAVVEMSRRSDDIIALSGRLKMTYDGVSGTLIRQVTDIPPARKTWDVASALHFAFFGGAPMRWLYLLCGLAGASMMASGLVLFTVKRQEKAPARGFYALVARINVAAVAGICLACAAYMWGVRLLPVQLPHRPDWEVNVFLLAWALAGAHALIRRPQQGWTEQFAAAALLCLTLPVPGFRVPNSSLPAMIAAGDWRTAGVDLTAMALGLVLAFAAYLVRGRRLEATLDARRSVAV
jgi:uncharacterized iron-regulated membrane protein